MKGAGVPTGVVVGLRRLGVATVYEASGRRGLVDAPLERVVPGSRAAGPARTVLCGQADNLAVHAALAPLVPAGLLDRTPGGFRLTARGFDAYHDLERWVTYQLIEPLWAEMLTEHTAPACAADSRAHWAAPDRARTGRAWSLASRLFERPP